jgi:hypothetical protein
MTPTRTRVFAAARTALQLVAVVLVLTYAARYLNPLCSRGDTSIYCGRSGLLELIPDLPFAP